MKSKFWILTLYFLNFLVMLRMGYLLYSGGTKYIDRGGGLVVPTSRIEDILVFTGTFLFFIYISYMIIKERKA